MGSSSWSQSKTNYTNTPVTQEDVSNPYNLTNSKMSNDTNPINMEGAVGSWAQANRDESVKIGGNLIFQTDSKAVGQAFDFGSKLVQVVADITRQNNVAAVAAAKEETKAAATGDTKTATATGFDFEKYKTELMLGGALLAWWFLGRKK